MEILMSKKIGSVGDMHVHHVGGDRYEIHGPSGLAGAFSVDKKGDFMGQRVTRDKEQQQKLTDIMVSHAKGEMKKSQEGLWKSVVDKLEELKKGKGMSKIEDLGKAISKHIEGGDHTEAALILTNHPDIQEDHLEDAITHPKSSSKVIKSAKSRAKSEGLNHLAKKAFDRFYEDLTKSLDLSKGKMDGVEIGGSPDSKNTKTYEKEFEKKDKDKDSYSPRYGQKGDFEHFEDVADANRSFHPKQVSAEGRKRGNFNWGEYNQAKKDLSEVKSKSGPVKTLKDLSPSDKANLEAQYGTKIKKDDKAHPPGSPEDSAHDVAELDRSISEEMKGLSSGEKRQMLSHLRQLKDKSKHRSKENQQAGQD
jgi:hypothetical protein